MAAVLSQPAVIAEGATAGYSKTSRRQYQACDQCRKSRRACDAGTLRVANFPYREDGHGHPEPSISPTEACSNCSRTSKRCTFAWLSNLPLQGLPKGVKRKLESTGLSMFNAVPAPESNYQTSSYNSRYSVDLSTLPQLLPAANSFHPMHHSTQATLPGYISPIYESPDQPNNYHSSSPKARYCLNYNADDNPTSFTTASNRSTLTASIQAIPDGTFSPSLLPQDCLKQEPWAPSTLSHHDTTSTSPLSMSRGSSNTLSKTESSPNLSSISSERSCEDVALHNRPFKKVKQRSVRTKNAGTTVADESSRVIKCLPRRANMKARSANRQRQTSVTVSTFQLRLSDLEMKRNIFSGLMQVYRDSFENSLSCWVTESNCPYETELKSLFNPATNLASTAEEAATKLGDSRFYSRVSRLDAAFSRLRGRKMSPSEDRAATNALNGAVMAFASQWSQSSHNSFWRSQVGTSRIGACHTHSASVPLVTSTSESMEYERFIQKTLWHEAWTAIQAVAEIDSFRVILAYMIFALTQRPVDTEKASTLEARNSPIGTAIDSRRGSGDAFTYDNHEQSTDPPMEDIMTKDWDPFYASDIEALASPPIYLELAVRNLFSWRRKIERYRRLCSKNNRDRGQGLMGPFAVKDHQTFNLLFWLGVMCDTTSSAISKRPLIIADEDCAIIREIEDESKECLRSESEQHLSFYKDQNNEADSLWGHHLLNFTNAHSRKTQRRWPCNFDEAASVLQDAIPAKVLMFRKVAALQTLAYRRTPPHQLEKCINDALGVYEHWNSIYLPFMNDCGNEHDNLPPTVKSWYVILNGHWHYGCLLLADTIAQVDKEEKTMEKKRFLRAELNLIRELRHNNALAIATIAQASLLEHAPSVPDNPEFHFACNSSAILTEPWTDILVRAMGSACKVFINYLSAWDNPTDPNHEWVLKMGSHQKLYDQAEACIQGITLLGRKSDAANCTAEVFWTKLDRVCSSRRSSTDTLEGA